MTKIKICGITNVEDALFAAEKGADFLGFIFYKKSPRCINIKDAAEVTSKLPRNVKTVGVFVNQTEGKIRKAVKACGLDYVQLHGDESAEFASQMSVPVIKSFRLRNENSLPEIEKYSVFAYLFDTYSKDFYGGTGKTFDLSLLENKFLKKPFFLSGGLTPENVEEAIRRVKPYAVDVASSVEEYPGKKDYQKIVNFIEAVSTNR